jgi:ATP-dependent Clp protease ATP-binding subunit ClpX
MDTSQILFICGGTFAGLVDIIRRRIGKCTIGFATEAQGKRTATQELGEVLHQVTPEDLIEFGMIPEFVGRLPLLSTLGPLDEAALMLVLTEPKNALCRQYQKLFELSGSELEFTPGALKSIADKALKRETGARALRAVLEELMLDVMYQLPSLSEPGRFIFDEAVVAGDATPFQKMQALRKESA